MKIFDFFAVNITMYSEKSKTYGTKFGSTISLLISIIIVLLIIAFGQDFYNRTNPLIVRETEITEDYLVYQISNKNFSVAVRLEDQNGNRLLDQNVYELRAYYKWYEIRDGKWSGKVERIKLVSCTEDMIFSKDTFNKLAIGNYLCPVLDDLKLGGSWSSNKVGYFIFQTFVCSKGAVIPNDDEIAENCTTDLSFEDIGYEKLNYFPYMSVYYQQALITPSNYTNGIQYEFKNEYFALEKSMTVADYYYFQVNKVVTDYGWILKNKQEDSIIGINTKTTSFQLNKFDYTYASRIGLMFFYLNKNIDKYNREFMKVQVLAANVGGIIKMFFVVAQLFVTTYNQNDLLFEISKKLYEEAPIKNSNVSIATHKINEKVKLNNYVNINNINNKSIDLNNNAIAADNNNFQDKEKTIKKSFIEISKKIQFSENKINKDNSMDSVLPGISNKSDKSMNNVNLNTNGNYLRNYTSPLSFIFYQFLCCNSYRMKYKKYSALLLEITSMLEVKTLINFVKKNYIINAS